MTDELARRRTYINPNPEFTALEAFTAITDKHAQLNQERRSVALPTLEDADMTLEQWRKRVVEMLMQPDDLRSWETAGAFCVAAWVRLANQQLVDPSSGDAA